MTEMASTPFSETKAPEAPERLHRGALGLVDISASTMANIGPAYSFYFGFAFLVFTAGIAAPLTIVVAGIAIALLGNTLAQFSRVQPSTGGFISFVGKTFGSTSAVTTALLCGVGYIIAISAVLAVAGGFLSITLQQYLHWNVPWGIFTVLLTLGAVLMMIRGVAVSTKLAGIFFGFEMLVLVVVSIAALVKNHGRLSAAPPLPFYYRKYRPSEFNVLKHLILPVLGMVAIAVPVYYLSKPGQLPPYDWFPYAALIILVVSGIYAAVLTSHDPTLGDRVGSIVADE
jgi:hypothetical protein